MTARNLLGCLPNFEPAACRDVDPELFFPAVGANGAAIESAREICHTCPSIDRCLDWAIAHNVDGIWGATTTQERVAIRRRIRTWGSAAGFATVDKNVLPLDLINAYNAAPQQGAAS
ncbi:MAG: transcription factor WhiB [Frankiales bacterium]|nr:transcription factor WhiB [Frankiales bacterium]